MLCLAGLFIRKESGFKSRQLSLMNANPKTMQLGADRDKLIYQCGLSTAQQSLLRQRHPCLSDPRAVSEYIVIGDSKAEAFYYGLVRESQPNKGGWTLIFTVLPDDKIYPIVSDVVINNPKLKVVVLAIALRNIFPINPDTGFIDADVTSSYPGKIALYSQAIQAYMRAGKRVVFVIDNPTFPDPTSCISGGLTSNPFLNKFLRRKENPRCTISYTDDMAGTQPYRQFVRELQKANPGLIVYDPTPLLCDKTHNLCTIIKDDNFLYSYSDHISDYANSMIAKDMLPMVYKLAQ